MYKTYAVTSFDQFIDIIDMGLISIIDTIIQLISVKQVSG